MSFHTITQLVKFALTHDSDVIEKLRNIPYNNRHEDKELKSLIQQLKKTLSEGSKIERFAICGWSDYESEKVFSDILENLPQLRKEYDEQLSHNRGKMSEFTDDNFEKYQDSIQQEIKEFENK
jgi:hypothetical protein